MKVALFFGSFNPIHMGHLQLANYVAESGLVDRVMIVISPQNPFKAAGDLMPDTVRFDLARRATEGYEKIEVSDVEFALTKPSYTVRTLEHLIAENPHDEFLLLMGADNVEKFRYWREYERIMELCQILVYPRLGYTTDLPFERMRWIDTPIIEISSTFIRRAIREGRDVRYFVHPSIYDDAAKAVMEMPMDDKREK